MEEIEEGGEVVVPEFGGPEALVLLVDGEDLARSGIAGGFGEFEMGFWRGIWGNAGLWGLEEEEEEGERGNGD